MGWSSPGSAGGAAIVTSPAVHLARGPARLCQALGLTLDQNGIVAELTPPQTAASFETGPRVGLRLAADRPWRFWIPGDPTVSRYVPAKLRRQDVGDVRS
jgi:DNA-3-methyladenine glycosylase